MVCLLKPALSDHSPNCGFCHFCMILIFQSQRLLFGSEVSRPVTVTTVADTNRCLVAKVTPNVMPTVPNHCKMVVSPMSCYVHLFSRDTRQKWLIASMAG